MNIIRAEVLGFCMGVQRAVELARREAARIQAEHSVGRVYTLGPLIHNPQVLDDLRRRGVEILAETCLPKDLSGSAVIIRAHGVSPVVEAELSGRGAAVIDATCPRVKTSQLKAAAFAEAGKRLFLAGEEHHAEIAGIRGYAEAGFSRNAIAPFCAVVDSATEAEKAAAKLHAENPGAKTALIGQTTISAETYQTIGGAIARFFPDLEIAQTICAAARERQDSLRDLFDKTDAIIIAGGKESANTRHLFAITEAAGKPCALVETAADIPPGFFKFKSVGIAAGASTPDTVIDAVEQALGGCSG